MAYRDDDEALAEEARELKRELDSVLAKTARPPSSTARPPSSGQVSDEPRRDRLRHEVANLRDQLREAESALAAQRGVAPRPPPKGRRDLQLHDPFPWPTAQPATPPTPPASGPGPLSCAAAIVVIAVAVFVGAYLLMAAVGYAFLG